MAWTPTLPAEPPTVPGWWHELSYNRLVARGRADRRAREQDRRRRQIARTAERAREALCLAETSASEATRYLRRCDGLPYERRSAGLDVEHFVGRQVGPREIWQAYLDEAEYSRSNRVR